MTYSLDTTLEGQNCEINFRNETVKCTVLSAFEHINKTIGVTRLKYTLEGQDGVVYDNVSPSEIKFLKPNLNNQKSPRKK
jgi:hypothetical protein